jgi:polar amino acid transport system substrate-binding protein
MKVTILVFVGLVVFGAGALIGPSAGAQTPVATVPPQELAFAGKLIICDDMPVPPYSMFDKEGNAFGIDPDLGRIIGARLGLKVDVVNVVFNTIIPAVQSRKCDIIMSAMNVTEERQKVIFQVPYAQTGRVFLVRKGNPTGVRTTLDLCGAKVGTQTGTVGVDQILGESNYKGRGLNQACAGAGKPPVDTKQFAKGTDALLALMAGQVDVDFTDSGTGVEYVKAHSDKIELSPIGIQTPTPQGIGIPFDRPGLKAAIEKVLKSVVEDGTYDAIFKKYEYPEGAFLTLKK